MSTTNTSSSLPRDSQLTVKEIFQTSFINKGGFGLDSYRTPVTVHKKSHAFTFPQSKQKLAQKNTFPGPCEYKSPTHNIKGSPKFRKAPRLTIISEIVKKNSSMPAPN